MASDNIFSGLKVVDLASFIAGPERRRDPVRLRRRRHQSGAARRATLWRIGHKIPPQPQAKDAYPFHLANRNKRGITLDLKSPSAQQVLERLVKWADVFIVNTPHPARKRLKLEYDDVAQWNPRLIYADLTGFGEKGPDADLPGFDITSYWARSGLLSMTRDAGAPPTWPVAGSGDNATAVGLYSAIVTALYRRERTGKGSYVTTSLLAEGVWSASVSIQAALCEAKFFAPHDRMHPANAALNVYRASDGTWFVLIVTPDKLAAVAKAIGRADLLTDPRFSDPAKLAQNMAQLTAILDEVFGSQPMAHWYEVFNGVHVTFGAVRGPQEVINDPQLRANDIVVPLEGAGGKLTSTISSPIQVHGVAKAPAKRAPELGEHNEEVLEQLGFQRGRNRRLARERRCSESRRNARRRPKIRLFRTACGRCRRIARACAAQIWKARAYMKATPETEMLWRVATARMPTKWGMFHATGFKREIASGIPGVETALAIVMGDLSRTRRCCASIRNASPAKYLGSLRCDCGDQLAMAMQAIADEGRGLVIYEYQEGRGIGLMAKLQAYELQDAGARHRRSQSCPRIQGRLQGFQPAGRDPA